MTAGPGAIYDKKSNGSVALGHGTSDYTHNEDNHGPQKQSW